MKYDLFFFFSSTVYSNICILLQVIVKRESMLDKRERELLILQEKIACREHVRSFLVLNSADFFKFVFHTVNRSPKPTN